MASTMNTAQKKWTTLAELEQKSIGPVWVMNTSEKSGDAAQILISVPKVNGTGVDVVRIPRTFIPIDLTMQVPRAQLLNAAEFRKTLQKGLINLASEPYAKALLSTSDGKAEQRRIENALMQAQVAADNATVASGDSEDDDYFDPNNMEEENAASKAAQTKKTEEKVQRDAQPEVNLKLQNLANTALEQKHSEQQIRSAIRNYGKKMNNEEFKFLASKFKSKEKVIALLKELKAKQKA